jgi:serine/threonine protein kinase
MYELLNNGQHPFYKKGMTKKELLRNIRDKNLTYINNISPLANNLLQQLLQKDLSKRITSSLALKHPWITRNESDPIPLNLYQQVNKIIIKNKMKNLLLISIFMNYMSNKSKNEINLSTNYNKTNKNVYNNQKNARDGFFASFDFTTKVPYYKSTSSHHITKYKIFSNLKVFSNNIIESNKNGNSENSSINLKNYKISPNLIENYSLISRNKNTFLPKISSHKSINKKILKLYNNTHEKCIINNSLKNLDTYKKNLFRNKSNWGRRNVNFIKHINNNKRYLK